MKIAKTVRELAVKHKITVMRNEHGYYLIWDSTDTGSTRYPLITQTSKGAINRIKTLVHCN